MSTNPVLVLLTSEFPFGIASEPFLETEIEVLAQRFDRVYVLPSHRVSGQRPLPENVELVEMDWLEEPSRAAKWRALASRDTARVLVWTLRSRTNVRRYARASRTYVDILARNLLKSSSLTRFVRDRHLEHAVFYDYWFENSTLALALLRHSGKLETAVSRAHRFDIYDECWAGGSVPFREAKARGLDAVFAVSEFGRDYLLERVPSLRSKIRVARLGVRDPGRSSPAGEGAAPLVVTCARLIPTKRVHLVPEVLERVGRPIRWVHFGDGPERARIVEAASRLNGNVSWELRGQIDNREVLAFYAANHVDAFLSLSVSEGLPVAMMEAQSYGIPVVARAVHGVPEIVNETTGVLLAPDATPADVGAGLEAVLEPGRFDAGDARAFFRQHFDAAVNYNNFADALIAIHAS